MHYVFPGDYWATFSMQSIGQWILPFMKFFTWLGYPQAYMILIAIIYWSVDRKLGLRMAIFLPVAASLNSILKQAFHAPRPYWLDQRVQAILPSNGFGMPSGHAQAATLWLYAGNYLKKGWFWVLAILITLMVGLSRVYLGVHFSSQVIAGWSIGIGLVIAFILLESRVLGWVLSLKLKDQLLFIGGVSVSFLLLGALFLFLLRNWEVPALWIRNASVVLTGEDESILYSVGLAATAGNAGGFLGTSVGALLMHKKGGFKTGGVWWNRIIRSITGLILVAALYLLLQLVAPSEEYHLLYSLWRFSGFFLISISAIFLIPNLLIRLRLLKPTNR